MLGSPRKIAILWPSPGAQACRGRRGSLDPTLVHQLHDLFPDLYQAISCFLGICIIQGRPRRLRHCPVLTSLQPDVVVCLASVWGGSASAFAFEIYIREVSNHCG